MAFYGDVSHGTMKAFAAEMDGKVVGVVGLVRENGVGKFFSDFAPELEPHLGSVTIMRAVKATMRFVQDYRGPVIAISEGPKSVKLLTRLGFTHLEGDEFGWLS